MSLDNIGSRKLWLFVFLVGLFITNAVIAELISNKLITIPISFSIGIFNFGPFTTIIGILPWPVVFIITDLLNEFYGEKAVRRVSWITAILIAYCFIIVGLSMQIPALEIPGSNLSDNVSYNKVFGQAQMVIVGSIVAFLVSQLLDAYIFQYIKRKTGDKYIWLRSTGSTLFSQLIDSYIVLFIGFVLPGSLSFTDYINIAPTNYVLKIVIAFALTPLIYFGHYLVKKYLNEVKESQ